MPYTFQSGTMYRMPTHFGPALGPRRGPGGKRFACKDNPKSTSISVSFLSNPVQLDALLPEGFEVDERPVVTVTATYMKEIEWLAGRGYNILGLTFPAVFRGKEDIARGPFLTVLWENLADPIITGREELGYSKIYCELPEPRFCQGEAHVTAGWLGFRFMDLSVSDLTSAPTDASPEEGGQVDGVLHYKYMPRTGEWGTPDACYPVITPAGGNQRVLERWSGKGTVRWHRAEWEDLPTMFPIVNAFADLEIVEYIGASLVRTVGGSDLSDQRILR